MGAKFANPFRLYHRRLRLDRQEVRKNLDKVFPQQASQENVFVEVEPILKSALDGNNVCILAYGQTGTSKTFTMDDTNYQPGIVSLALKELFHQASLGSTAFITFSMSMLEVYMGNLRTCWLINHPIKRMKSR